MQNMKIHFMCEVTLFANLLTYDVNFHQHHYNLVDYMYIDVAAEQAEQ